MVHVPVCPLSPVLNSGSRSQSREGGDRVDGFLRLVFFDCYMTGKVFNVILSVIFTREIDICLTKLVFLENGFFFPIFSFYQ